jgi:hypothetical protein
LDSELAEAVEEIPKTARAEFARALLAREGPVPGPARHPELTDGQVGAVAEEEWVELIRNGVGAHLKYVKR